MTHGERMAAALEALRIAEQAWIDRYPRARSDLWVKLQAEEPVRSAGREHLRCIDSRRAGQRSAVASGFVPKDAFPRYPRTEDHLPDGDPVGRDAMCRLTGRSRMAVQKWIERDSLPAADGPWVDGPTWKRSTFMAWAYLEGYLRDPATQRPLPAHDEGKRWAAWVPTNRAMSVRDARERALDGPWVVGWEDEDGVEA